MIDVFDFVRKLNLEAGTVLEIGSHMGFDSEKIYECANKPKMFCFEPDPRNIKILRERGIDNIATIIEKAVAEDNGKKIFYLSTGDIPEATGNDYYDLNEWSASSSLRPFKEHTKVFPWCLIKEAITVEATTLDQFASDFGVDHVNFIWMDVQGWEDLVFAGGQELLKQTEYVFTEYSKSELYRGQKTLDEIMSMLPGEWRIVGYDESGLNVLLENMECKNNKIGPTGIWNTKNLNEHVFDKGLANGIKDLMHSTRCSTMYDFGCGHGKYTKFLNINGLETKGFDGNPFTKELTGDCEVLDLTVPFEMKKVDWVLCLEVGEHIPKKFEKFLLDNITSHANTGVILSWGIPDQGGYGHVNCITNEYVMDEMKKRHFKPLTEAQNKLRWLANSSWFKNTIMVFEKMTPVEIEYYLRLAEQTEEESI